MRPIRMGPPEAKEVCTVPKGRKNMTAMSEQEAKIKEFFDMLSPSIIKFNVNQIVCGNTHRCVWALREYPTSCYRRKNDSKTGCIYKQDNN